MFKVNILTYLMLLISMPSLIAGPMTPRPVTMSKNKKPSKPNQKAPQGQKSNPPKQQQGSLQKKPESQPDPQPVVVAPALPIDLASLETLEGSALFEAVVDILEKIETNTPGVEPSKEVIDWLNLLVANYAKEGMLPDGSEESLSVDSDVQELLTGESPLGFSFGTPDTFFYNPTNALAGCQDFYYLSDLGEYVLCKSWISNAWHRTKKFVKKHKKAIIIGAVVVVAVTVCACVVLAATSQGAAAGAAAASKGALAGGAGASSGGSLLGAGAAAATALLKPEEPSNSSINPLSFDPSLLSDSLPSIKESLRHEIDSIKFTLAKEDFFATSSTMSTIPSWEDSGRALVPLITHESFNHVINQAPYDPNLSDFGALHSLPASLETGHQEIDSQFHTNYAPLYFNKEEVNFMTLAYLDRGERALSSGNFEQAVHDLDRVIASEPTSATPYLERGIAHLGLKQYDNCLADYEHFVEHSPPIESHDLREFAIGFAEGLPKGLYESGSGLYHFAKNLIRHPIQTSKQVYQSISILVELAKSKEWSVIGEMLAPEIHQLIKDWDTLPPKTRGKLAGHACGKHGLDLLAPGTAAKGSAALVKYTKEFITAKRGLDLAGKTLIFESVGELRSAPKIAEAMAATEKGAALGEELGIGGKQMAGVGKQAGRVDGGLGKPTEICKDPLLELKQYAGKIMPEDELRRLLEQAGIPTFARPQGIPSGFRVVLSKKSGGIKYIHPDHTHESIRVMPGNPNSPNPCQQKPYVVHMKDGKAIDKYGKPLINPTCPEAHIPIEEFIYKRKLKMAIENTILQGVLNIVAIIADRQFQQKAWVEHRAGPYAFFEETMHHLFDDYNLADLVNRHKAYDISEEQYQVLNKFYLAIDAYSDDKMSWLEVVDPKEVLADPNWEIIIGMAKEVLKAFNYPSCPKMT